MKNIRSVGLAAILALAVFAVPSVASASGGLEADSYPVKYQGYAAGSQIFSNTGTNEFTCPQVSMAATASGTAGTLPMTTSLTCEKNELHMNGCKFELHAGTQSTVDIGPPGCGPINNLYLSTCEYSIPSQTGVPATFTNTEAGGYETVHLHIYTALQSTHKYCTWGGTLEYLGEWEIRGYDVNGNSVDIRATNGFNGFFAAGKASEKEAEQPKFEAEKYPVKVGGGVSVAHPFTFTMPPVEGNVSCTSGQLSAELSGASKSLSLGASLGCAAGKEAASVTMNSCRFTAGLANSGPPYVGGLGIACTKEGDRIEVSTASCTAKFPAQSTVSTVNYENQGSAKARVLRTVAAPTGLSYTFDKGICQLLGKTHTDGKISFDTTFEALGSQ